jgi:Mrp family chromosome partitioning ATPase
MDRIRLALDLAREDRRHASESTPQDRPALDPKKVLRLPTGIVYTRTRVFAPSTKVLEANRIIPASSRDPAAAAFRVLRTQVLQRLEENKWRSLAILSPGGNDGKTTTAINLAVSLASDHRHSVLLVDFDLKRPALASRFDLTPEFGSDDLLRGAGGERDGDDGGLDVANGGGVRVESCLYHPEGFERLVILPARAPMENSSEALAGPLGRGLVAELRGRYPDRIVLFDLPPVLGADDALAFAPLVECGLMVVAEGATRREDLLRCMELMRKTPIIGTVLNRATEAASAYG